MFSQTLQIGYFLSTVALFGVFVVSLLVQLRSRRDSHETHRASS